MFDPLQNGYLKYYDQMRKSSKNLLPLDPETMKHGAIWVITLPWVPMVDSIKTSWSWISFTHSNLFPPIPTLVRRFQSTPRFFVCQKITVKRSIVAGSRHPTLHNYHPVGYLGRTSADPRPGFPQKMLVESGDLGERSYIYIYISLKTTENIKK